MDRGTNRLVDELGSEDRNALLAAARTFLVRGGEALRESGDPVTHAHLPTEGVLAALCITSSGSTVETGLVGREGVIPSIVECESLDTSRRVLALTDVTGWRIDLAELAALVNQRPGLREAFQAYAGRVLREAEARLAGAVLHTADNDLRSCCYAYTTASTATKSILRRKCWQGFSAARGRRSMKRPRRCRSLA